jgi:hypothetical protein
VMKSASLTSPKFKVGASGQANPWGAGSTLHEQTWNTYTMNHDAPLPVCPKCISDRSDDRVAARVRRIAS